MIARAAPNKAHAEHLAGLGGDELAETGGVALRLGAVVLVEGHGDDLHRLVVQLVHVAGRFGIGLGQGIMSWGRDIGEAQTSIRTSPQVLLFPSIALSITVLAFLMLGDVLRDALDPQARARRGLSS